MTTWNRAEYGFESDEIDTRIRRHVTFTNFLGARQDYLDCIADISGRDFTASGGPKYFLLSHNGMTILWSANE